VCEHANGSCLNSRGAEHVKLSLNKSQAKYGHEKARSLDKYTSRILSNRPVATH
jgi:hypothetical protein